MKNTNITLHTTQKKEYVLTGILSLPLHLGERAWIYSYNQTFATSPVQSILEVSENGVVFETCNSIYRLSYTRVPMELRRCVLDKNGRTGELPFGAPLHLKEEPGTCASGSAEDTV